MLMIGFMDSTIGEIAERKEDRKGDSVALDRISLTGFLAIRQVHPEFPYRLMRHPNGLLIHDGCPSPEHQMAFPRLGDLTRRKLSHLDEDYVVDWSPRTFVTSKCAQDSHLTISPNSRLEHGNLSPP